MSRHDDKLSLRQMLDHVEEAVSLAHGHARSDLDTNRLLFLALLKLVEIAGEAAARVSPATQAALPSLPWRELIGTRNRLVHGYDSVDPNILWEIAAHDFPFVAEHLRRLLPPL